MEGVEGVKKLISIIRKALRDFALTFYDDGDFKYMSLPRVLFVLSGICVIVAWVSDQFFGLKFAEMTTLVGWNASQGGIFAANKVIKGKFGAEPGY